MTVRFGRVIVALVGTLLTLTVAGPGPAHAIYNGYDAPFDHYRFMVSLRQASLPDRHICGGTLIEPDIVLTAAHCVSGAQQTGLVAVVAANTPEWPNARRVPVTGYRVPIGYNLSLSNRDDIAVVRLAARQTSPTIKLAATEPKLRARVETAGWGCTDRPLACTTHPTVLQAAHQTVIDDSSCGLKVFWNPPSYGPTSICTKGNKSTINHGDSGGPLLAADGQGGFTQVGVTSLGADDPKKLEAAFTSVPAETVWIADAIKSLRANEHVLLFGTGDYGNVEPRDNLATLLTNAGYQVDVASTLPVNLDPYGSVFYISTDPLADNDIHALVDYVQRGRGLYLTGERPCCEQLNVSDTAIVNSLVVSVGGITIGNQGDPFYATGPVDINPDAAGRTATTPYQLRSWTVSAPGGINNIYGNNVLAYATAPDGTVTPVAGVWSSEDVVGAGRLAILMDINWLEAGYWDQTGASQLAQNLALFLGGYPIPPAPAAEQTLRLAKADNGPIDAISAASARRGS